MKRFILILTLVLIGSLAFAQFSGSTVFGAYYDIANNVPYWGVQPSATLTISKSTLKATVEYGTYDVADDATVAACPLNAVLVATLKDAPNLSVAVTGSLLDIVAAPTWSVVVNPSYVLGMFTPAVTVTANKDLLFPATWTLGFKPFDKLSFTATLVQSSLMKIPETAKLSGTVSY